MYLFEDVQLPEGFSFPSSYVEVVKGNLVPNVHPWWFVFAHPDTAKLFLEILNESKGSKKFLIPFAKIDDDGSGDIACFDGDDRSGDPKVYFSSGTEDCHRKTDWEQRYHFVNFDAWLKDSSS